MTTLFEQLVQISSDITEVKAAEFGICLIIVSKHINTEPESLALSLQDWGRWLDDGGYGSENFAAILLQITEAELGVPAASTLWTYAQSICAAAEGIPSLIEHVQTDYPGLEQRITSLEALALNEQGLIEQTAGGMSKTGQIVAGSVGGVLVAGLVTYGIHRVFKTRRARTARENAIDLFNRELGEAEKYAKDRLLQAGTVSERGFKTRNQLTFDEADELQERFLSRSVGFDFHAYARSKENEVMRKGLTAGRKDIIASNLWQDFYDTDKSRLLTDEERKLCSILPSKSESQGYHKLNKQIYDDKKERNPFDVYAENRFTVEESEDLLRMTDKEFFEFANGAGKEFLRKEGVLFLGDIKYKVDYNINAFEEDAKNNASNLEDGLVKKADEDIEIDVTNKVEGLANNLESDITTDAENIEAGATKKITSAEADMV